MLSQADVARITEVTETFAKSVLNKNWDAVASLYVDDAVFNPPNQPTVKGRAAINEWFRNFPPLTAFKTRNVTVEGRDDLAYVLGTYSMTIVPPGAPGPVNDSGNYVEIRRKQADGSWLIAVDMFNSELPA